MQDKSRNELLTIAKTLGIKGLTRMNKTALIEAIQEKTSHQLVDTSITTPDTTTVLQSIPAPQEFFNRVIALDDVLEVHQTCNELLDQMTASYSVANKSKNLTAYKKLFYTYIHANPKLNETVTTKQGEQIQHIAGRLLTLSDEELQKLKDSRKQKDNARDGFDETGEIREIEKPKTDIEKIIRKSLDCLNSNDPHIIGAGIINLTGLRANEQNMPAREYRDLDLLIHREMVVIDEFAIAFKGVSKKSNPEALKAYYVRATLAPAKMIVEAQKRFTSTAQVKKIKPDYESYRKGFMRTFETKYLELFGGELSTLEAYDDDGVLANENGTPHKGRAFYACALRSILKQSKGFRNTQATKYIQLCLAHESDSETQKYLGRYDETEFINPIEINIPTNINELGKQDIKPMSTATEVKEEIQPKAHFDIDAFISALDGNMQAQFNQLLSTGVSLNNALITLINTAKAAKTIKVDEPKKPSVSSEIDTIVGAVMVYNQEQTLNTNCVVPTYSLVDKIAQKRFNKSLFKKTVDTWLGANTIRLNEELERLTIPGGIHNSGWNGKHHRKTMDTVINSIITIINRG